MYTWRCPESFVMFMSFRVSLLRMFKHVWIRMTYTSFAVAVADCRYGASATFLRGKESIIFCLVLRKSSMKNADIRKTVCIYEVASRANISYWQKAFQTALKERKMKSVLKEVHIKLSLQSCPDWHNEWGGFHVAIRKVRKSLDGSGNI
jgi:hypothetical protein